MPNRKNKFFILFTITLLIIVVIGINFLLKQKKPLYGKFTSIKYSTNKIKGTLECADPKKFRLILFTFMNNEPFIKKDPLKENSIKLIEINEDKTFEIEIFDNINEVDNYELTNSFYEIYLVPKSFDNLSDSNINNILENAKKEAFDFVNKEFPIKARFEYVKYNEDTNIVEGKVIASDYSNFKVVLFIGVNGNTYVKPMWASNKKLEMSEINNNGEFSIRAYDTISENKANDIKAEFWETYLVSKSFDGVDVDRESYIADTSKVKLEAYDYYFGKRENLNLNALQTTKQKEEQIKEKSLYNGLPKIDNAYYDETDNYVKGKVLADNTENYKVVLFISIFDNLYVKPMWAPGQKLELSNIKNDGTFSIRAFDTNPLNKENDITTSKWILYLVPSSFEGATVDPDNGYIADDENTKNVAFDYFIGTR